jgi:hypothetical protein
MQSAPSIACPAPEPEPAEFPDLNSASIEELETRWETVVDDLNVLSERASAAATNPPDINRLYSAAIDEALQQMADCFEAAQKESHAGVESPEISEPDPPRPRIAPELRFEMKRLKERIQTLNREIAVEQKKRAESPHKRK